MTSSTITAVNHNEPMDPPHPRADGPRRRRAFTASDKIAHLHAYEQACEHGEGGAYLRREGLYSSLISEWRKQRDAGVLAGKRPGEKVGRLTAEQAEIARLTRELARANKRLHTTEDALDIMEKHTLSGVTVRESGLRRAAQEALTETFAMLTGHGVSTRQAATLTGLVRSTATRRRNAATALSPQSAPSLRSSRPTNSPMPNGAGSLRCSPATGSSISRRCRSTLSCSTRASICVRCPRCTGCWDSTRWSPNAAGWRGTPARCARSWSRPHRSRCTAGTSPNSRAGRGHLFRCVRDDRHLPATSSVFTSMPTNPVFWRKN